MEMDRMDQYFEKVKGVVKVGWLSIILGTFVSGARAVLMAKQYSPEDVPSFLQLLYLLIWFGSFLLIGIKIFSASNKMQSQYGSWRVAKESIESLRGKMSYLTECSGMNDSMLGREVMRSIRYDFPVNIAAVVSHQINSSEELRLIIQAGIDRIEMDIQNRCFWVDRPVIIKIWDAICGLKPPYLVNGVLYDFGGQWLVKLVE